MSGQNRCIKYRLPPRLKSPTAIFKLPLMVCAAAAKITVPVKLTFFNASAFEVKVPEPDIVKVLPFDAVKLVIFERL